MWFTFSAYEETLTAGMTALLITGLVLFSWLITLFLTREQQFSWLNFIGIIIGVGGLIIMLGWKAIFSGDAIF